MNPRLVPADDLPDSFVPDGPPAVQVALAQAQRAGDSQAVAGLQQHLVELQRLSTGSRLVPRHDLPDGFEPDPVGMGDVQGAQSARVGAGNVPAALLTGDPATDEAISRNLAAQGLHRNILPSDATRAAAVTAGMLVPEALPGALGAGVGGALLSGGLSEAQDAAGRAWDAVKGGAIGYGAGRVLTRALAAIGRHASAKVEAARATAEAEATKLASDALHSEVGRLGGMTADLNRKAEWMVRLLDEEGSGALTAEHRMALEALRASPDYVAVVNAAARRLLDTTPGAAANVAGQAARVAELQANMPQAIADATAARVSPAAARAQVMARVRRYGPPAIGSAVGSAIGGPLGGAVGSLAGAGTRPMIQSVRRMAADPAVQTQLWEPLAQLAEAAPPLQVTIPAAAQATIRALRRLPPLIVERVPTAAGGRLVPADDIPSGFEPDPPDQQPRR